MTSHMLTFTSGHGLSCGEGCFLEVLFMPAATPLGMHGVFSIFLQLYQWGLLYECMNQVVVLV